MKAALKPPVAEGGAAVHGGGNRRDWFLGAGGRGAAFIATLPASGMSPSPSTATRRPYKAFWKTRYFL